jgi:hypothetical protein
VGIAESKFTYRRSDCILKMSPYQDKWCFSLLQYPSKLVKRQKSTDHLSFEYCCWLSFALLDENEMVHKDIVRDNAIYLADILLICSLFLLPFIIF